MRLAALLLLLIAGTHYLYPVLSINHADPQYTAQAWFYILRGCEGAVLFLVCGLLAGHRLVSAVCCWGFVEEGQTAACRFAAGVDERPQVELFSGLCGTEFYYIGLLAALWLALTWLDKRRGPKHGVD